MNLKIIDNFLNESDLNYLSNLKLHRVADNSLKVYHNSIDKFENINVECIDNKRLKDINSTYHNFAIKILKEMNPSKVKLYDYSEFHIIETGANYKFPIHDDTPNKLLSGVIYLRPEQNSGTIFYKNKKGDGKKIVDWKINRAVFFSRAERSTWHSYEGDGKSNRLALVYNLMTNDIKGVYKAENKNYFLGNLRYKINPYLYRFFKFTI